MVKLENFLGFKEQGVRSKEQGAKIKEQGIRSKDEFLDNLSNY